MGRCIITAILTKGTHTGMVIWPRGQVSFPVLGIAVTSRLCWGSLLVCFVCSSVACGGGRATDFNNVTVTVSPTSATVTAGGQVSLNATVSGLPGDSVQLVIWSIAELQTNGASGSQCNWLGSTPPPGPCPDGTIQGASPLSDSVTYIAPSTAGTFHVIATWSTAVNPPVIKTATATIMVTP